MNDKLNPIAYHFIYTIDIIVKSGILIICSPALLIVNMINIMWRVNAKVNDKAHYYSLNNNRINVIITERINSKEVEVLIKGTYNRKIINLSKLNKISL